MRLTTNYLGLKKSITLGKLCFWDSRLGKRILSWQKSLLWASYCVKRLHNTNEKLKGLPLMFLTRETNVKSPSMASETLRWNLKLHRETHTHTYISICKEKEDKRQMMMLSNLWGHCFKSSSDDLRRRSTNDFPKDSFEARGGGFSSMSQILFLANPCWSSDPQSPNFKHTHTHKQLNYNVQIKQWEIWG